MSGQIYGQDATHLPVSSPVDTDSAGRGGTIALQSVMRIICIPTDSQGTGFLHKSGRLITAAHVVHSCSDPLVILANGSTVPAKVEAHDDDLDLAIVQPSVPITAPVMPISDGADLKIGTQVSTWGYPGGYSGRAPMLSVGYLAGLDARRNQSGKVVTQWVVNAAFNSGNSGGPLVHIETGQVIGVVSSKLAPISLQTAQILSVLQNQNFGMMYTQTLPDGSTKQISEAHLVGVVLDELRRQVQLVIGYAALTSDLRSFLTANGIEP